MYPETPFRLAVLAVTLVSGVIAGRFRIMAQRAGGSVSRQGEGWPMLLLLRPLGLALWIATLVYLIRPQAMPWARWSLPDLVRWLGLPICLLGDVLVYWTLRNLGKNLTDTVTVRTGATLVTSGPYRYVRHPYYVSVAVVLAGFVLLTASWLIGLIGLLIFALLAIRTRREEAQLLERFGDDYRNYMSATGRFFPKLGRRPVAKDF